jgi:hypothetical protein
MYVTPHLNIHIWKNRINSFHFFGVTGFICGTVLGTAMALQLQLIPYIVLLMGVIGAITFFGLTFLSKWITGNESIVYYHHEITILILCALVLYFLKVPILRYLDIAILGIGVFLAFGRIGCFSVGCCHGRPQKNGVTYGQQHVDAGFTWYYKNVPLLPVQLIESAYVFLTVITGIILLFNHVPPGTVLIVYTVIYGLMRYILEFLRGDPERPLWLGVSEAQWTSLALTAITYGLSIAGWLPFYTWHPAILILEIVLSLFTIYYYKRNTQQQLLSPSHIRQIAEGLNWLKEVNKKPEENGKNAVNLYNTNAGLCLSCGNSAEGENIRHFTISMDNKRTLDKPLAERIAELIASFNHYHGQVDLIEKRSNIYHIVFLSPDL